MEDDSKIVVSEALGLKTRRAFVKTAAQVAVTAPAVAMLLSASTKKAQAQVAPYSLGDDTVILSTDDQGGFNDDTYIASTGDDFIP